MNKALPIILAILISAAVFGGVGYWLGTQKAEKAASTATATVTTTAKTSGTATADVTADWKSDAENTVTVFTENLLASAPYAPTSDGVNGTKANIALGKLTAAAQATVEKNSPNSISGGLALFCGIQDTPDKGTTITSSMKSDDNTVTVLSKWTYSGEVVTKTFTLILENNQWKISQVK